jgi:hypothetical protein
MRWWDRPSDLVPIRDWRDSIEVRTQSIQSYLAELPEPERNRAIADYLETVAPEDRDDEHRELLSLIDDVRSEWASVGRLDMGLRCRVFRYKEVALRVPLFEFSAPDVEGCSISR